MKHPSISFTVFTDAEAERWIIEHGHGAGIDRAKQHARETSPHARGTSTIILPVETPAFLALMIHRFAVGKPEGPETAWVVYLLTGLESPLMLMWARALMTFLIKQAEKQAGVGEAGSVIEAVALDGPEAMKRGGGM